MVFGSLVAWFSRIGAYWTDKRVHKAAKRKEMRDRKIRETRWNELRQPRPTFEMHSDPPQRPQAHRGAVDMNEEPGSRRREEQPFQTTPPSNKKTVNLKSSNYTLDLGRIRAGEVFYRGPDWNGACL